MNQQRKIKLLIFVPSLACGGMEKYVSLLCNNINTNNFDVTLAVLDNSQPFFTITNKNIAVVDLHVPHVRNAIFKILRLIKKIEPDIVFSTGNHLNLYLSIFRRFISRKIKVIARETSIVSINSQRAKFAVLYNVLVKKFYRNLDMIISQSKFMEHDLIKNYRIPSEKSIVIYNPVEQFTNEIATSPIDAIPTFITVARLSVEKGIDRLLKAAALLQFPFRYYIIGAGNQQATLQQLINTLQLQDKVFLQGSNNNPFLRRENASLFLMGSRYEGLGNVLLEAGARGIPTIAFDAPGGIGEIIVAGVNGFLVTDNDEAAFAAAITKALATNFNRQQIKAITQAKFSIAHIVQQVEELFIREYKKIQN